MAQLTRRDFTKYLALAAAAAALPALPTQVSATRPAQSEAGAASSVFVGPAPDGKSLMLYAVQGTQLTPLVPFPELTLDDEVEVSLAPNGQHVACVLRKSYDGASSLEVVSLAVRDRRPISQGAGRLTDEKGAARERISSAVWFDDATLLYTKVRFPSQTEIAASWAASAPFPVQGEVWRSNLTGSVQDFFVDSPLQRLLGVAPDKRSLYATWLIPGTEAWGLEGFALLDLASAELRPLWPTQADPHPHLRHFKLVAAATAAPRVLWVDVAQAPGGFGKAAPTIWLGDPATGAAERLWTVETGLIQSKGTHLYASPSDLHLAAYDAPYLFYVMGGTLWRVNRKEGREEPLGQSGRALVAWTSQGLVSCSGGHLRFHDTASGGQTSLVGSDTAIGGPLDVTMPPGSGVHWDVPFVHQLWDTADWFDGNWACGPTSAVMILAAYQRLTPWPMNVSSPQPHNTDYGRYVTDEYTYISVSHGTNTFNRAEPDASGTLARGAYGQCVYGGFSYNLRIREYVAKHDVGLWHSDAPTQADVKGDLDGGGVVILGTTLTGSGGHIIVVRGYNDNGYICNDPYGAGADQSWDGANVVYTWNELGVRWYTACFSPQILAGVRSDSTLVVQNSSAWAGEVRVYLVNPAGTMVGSQVVTVPGRGAWKRRVADMPGGANFFGAAVVIPWQTDVWSLALRHVPGGIDADNSIVPAKLGDPAFEGVAKTLYVPSVYNNIFGGVNTNIHLMNLNRMATNVTITYFGRAGYADAVRTLSLAPNATTDLFSGQQIGSGAWVGSARITSDLPLAAKTFNSYPQGYARSTNAATGGSNLLYAAAAYKTNYARTSGVVVQNLGASEDSVDLIFYDRSGQHRLTHSLGAIGGQRANGVFFTAIPNLPENWAGSIRIQSRGGKPLAAIIVAERPNAGHSSYNAASKPGRRSHLPRAAKRASGRTTSYVLMNSSGTAMQVTASYYNLNGGLVGEETHTVAGYGAVGRFHGDVGFLPEGWEGSVILRANQPWMVVVFREDETNGIGEASGIMR